MIKFFPLEDTFSLSNQNHISQKVSGLFIPTNLTFLLTCDFLCSDKKLSLTFSTENVVKAEYPHMKYFLFPRLIKADSYYVLSGFLKQEKSYFVIAKFEGKILQDFPYRKDNDLIKPTLKLFSD